MSTYELDDELVRRVVGGRTSADDQDDLFRVLEEQLPNPEPDREYLVKDRQGDIWRWDVRQAAWHCVTAPTAYLRWERLVREYAPVTLYGPIS